MRRVVILIFMFSLGLYSSVYAQGLNILTWNIENLGSQGRGATQGFGATELPLRTDLDLQYIGGFIEQVLKADIIAIQEVAITDVVDGIPVNEPLNKIITFMGPEWQYAIAPKRKDDTEKSQYVGYIWNSSTVRALDILPMPVPQVSLAGKPLFEQVPLIGYFEALGFRGEAENDFVLVNVQLSEGEDNDENHLIAITHVEQQLTPVLKAVGITEQDRIILGTFNDNPYRANKEGEPLYTNALYDHMSFKGYEDAVQVDAHSTRMDLQLSSVIDHILINEAASKHILGEERADIWLPKAGASVFPAWRRTYSDHFPIRIQLRVSYDDDAD